MTTGPHVADARTAAGNPIDIGGPRRVGRGRRRPLRARTLLLTLATLFVVTACSGDISFSIGGQSVDDAAVELIEGDLADQIGLGELTAACPEVPDAEVGTEFDCTATTADGAVIEIAGVDRSRGPHRSDHTQSAVPGRPRRFRCCRGRPDQRTAGTHTRRRRSWTVATPSSCSRPAPSSPACSPTPTPASSSMNVHRRPISTPARSTSR